MSYTYLSPPNFFPIIFNSPAVFMPSQEEDTVPLSQWSQGGRGNSNNNKKEIDIITICLRKFSSSSWFGGSPFSNDLKRPPIFVGFFKGLLGNRPIAITFLPLLLFEEIISDTRNVCWPFVRFRLWRDNLLCSLNNRGVSLAHDTKQVLFYRVERPLSEEGPSQWDSECLCECGLE